MDATLQHAPGGTVDEQEPAHANVEPPPEICMQLLGSFDLTVDGASVPLPLSAQRLLALLALAEGPLQRCNVGGVLWPDKPESRAMANLRSTLWRVRQPGVELIDATAATLSLVDDVRVDTRLVAAGLVVDGSGLIGRGLELLADWYEDWVLVERERLRHLQLFALEARCRDLIDAGDIAGAVDIGLRLVALEPLREGSHRALIAAHLADNNVGESVRQFDRYCELVRTEFGVEPSDELVGMSPAFARRLDHARPTATRRNT